MKKEIILNLNKNKLNFICLIVGNIDIQTAWVNATKEQRVAYCLIDELLKKLRKKAIDKENTIKNFKMKFEYSKAYALYQALITGYKILPFEDPYDYYSDCTIKSLIAELDKQLI